MKVKELKAFLNSFENQEEADEREIKLYILFPFLSIPFKGKLEYIKQDSYNGSIQNLLLKIKGE